MASTRYAIPSTDREREHLARLLGASFGVAADSALTWLGKAGHDNLRVLFDEGTIVVPVGANGDAAALSALPTWTSTSAHCS